MRLGSIHFICTTPSLSLTAVIKFVRTESMGSTVVGRVDVRMAFALMSMGFALALSGGVVPFVNQNVRVASMEMAAVKNVPVSMEPSVISSMVPALVLMVGWEMIVLNHVRSV